MRTTVDIPDEIYRALKIKAASEGRPVRQVILQGIQRELNKVEVHPARKLNLPLIRSTRPDKIDLTNEQIYDIIGFP